MSKEQWKVLSERFTQISREADKLLNRHRTRRMSSAALDKIRDLHAEQHALWSAKNRLAREKFVLAMRAKGKTFREISEELGVTVERARQIHVRAERRRGNDR